MAQEQQPIEESAPTVEEAVKAGLAKLGLTEDLVDVEIVDEGRRGLFGMGGRDAIVRLRPRQVAVEKTAEPPQREPVQSRAEKAPAQAQVEAVDMLVEESAPPESDGGTEEDSDDAGATAVAVEVVTSLLRQMDVEAAVEVTTSEPDDLTGRRVTVLNITGEDLGLLIGARGETLDALQHLARLMVGHRLRQRANFVIDVEGYRERREQALARLAERMGKKAVDRGRPVTLEPMPAYERRIIHMTLRENPQVRTESTGEGDRRKVRIYPL